MVLITVCMHLTVSPGPHQHDIAGFFFFANPFKRQLHITNVVTVVGNSTAVLPRRVSRYGQVDPLCRICVTILVNSGRTPMYMEV